MLDDTTLKLSSDVFVRKGITKSFSFSAGLTLQGESCVMQEYCKLLDWSIVLVIKTINVDTQIVTK